jgi:NAD(P)H-dependent FMN reductase
MTPDELAQRATELVREHAARIEVLLDREGDVSDADLPYYDETNEAYEQAALELLQEYVRQNDG